MPTPFTDDQKAAIRNYLGWSELYHDLDPRLEGQLDSLPNTSPSAQTRVITTLGKLADIDSILQCAAENNLDLISADDNVTFRGPEQLEALRNQGRMLIQQMAIVFFVQPLRDYYAFGDGYNGDLIPLG